MSAFDANRPDVIEIHGPDWDAHEFCTARTIVRAGDEEWVLNQQMIIQPKQGNRKQRRASGFQKQNAEIETKNQLGAINRLWVQKMLESWTFTKGGQLMPFAKSGQNELDDRRMGKVMQLLDQTYVDYIFEQIQAAQPEQAQPETEEEDEEDEEGTPFFENASDSTDGETSQEEEDLFEELITGNKPVSRNFLTKS